MQRSCVTRRKFIRSYFFSIRIRFADRAGRTTVIVEPSTVTALGFGTIRSGASRSLRFRSLSVTSSPDANSGVMTVADTEAIPELATVSLSVTSSSLLLTALKTTVLPSSETVAAALMIGMSPFRSAESDVHSARLGRKLSCQSFITT